MTDNQQRIKELLGELEHLLEKEQEILLPANIFSGSHTPLQAATLFLSQQGYAPKQLSRLLLRPKNVIDNALQTGQTKESLPNPKGPTISVKAFQELRHTPGEAIVYALRQQKLSNIQTAKALGKDPRNTWKLHDAAKKKLGGGTQ